MYSDSTVICRQKWKKNIFCFLIFTSKDSFDLVTKDGYRWFAVNFTCLNHTGCRGSNMANSCHSCRAWILMQLWFKWVFRKLISIVNCSENKLPDQILHEFRSKTSPKLTCYNAKQKCVFFGSFRNKSTVR